MHRIKKFVYELIQIVSMQEILCQKLSIIHPFIIYRSTQYNMIHTSFSSSDSTHNKIIHTTISTFHKHLQIIIYSLYNSKNRVDEGIIIKEEKDTIQTGFIYIAPTFHSFFLSSHGLLMNEISNLKHFAPIILNRKNRF